MSALLRRLLDRSTKKVNRIAAGTRVPAGTDRGEHKGPTARERTLMRRRLRALRRRREALGREVDGPALESTQEELEAVDAEARTLVHALEELKTLDELLASGVSSRCANCGELVATREHYCTNCGAEQRPARRPATPEAPAPQRAREVTGASSARAQTPPGR